MKNWLRVSVLLGLFAPAGWAVDWKALKPQGYVSDFANVIDAASKSQLEAYCATVEGSTGVQMALVTIPATRLGIVRCALPPPRVAIRTCSATNCCNPARPASCNTGAKPAH